MTSQVVVVSRISSNNSSTCLGKPHVHLAASNTSAGRLQEWLLDQLAHLVVGYRLAKNLKVWIPLEQIGVAMVLLICNEKKYLNMNRYDINSKINTSGGKKYNFLTI